MQGDFLQRFAAAGFTTEQVDTVLCTHMQWIMLGGIPSG